MTVDAVFLLGPTTDPTYPELLSGHPRNRSIDWRAVGIYALTASLAEPGPWDAYVKSDLELDAVWMAGIGPAVSDRLRAALESTGGIGAEFLPFLVNGSRFWILRVVTVIDALDLERSTISYFDDGSWDTVQIPRWIGARIPDGCLFRTPQEKRVWATPAVVAAYEASGCGGLHFSLRGEVV